MAGQKFQYDESGSTFSYFVLSFLALLLIPATYYWWPRSSKKGEEDSDDGLCLCNGCQKKRIRMQGSKYMKFIKQLLVKLVLISCWCFVGFLVYRISHFEYEYATFDPYDILGVPVGSSDATIKKAYRRLSLVLHPDKKETGNEKLFMKLTKAYQALTDETAKHNWEKYGNPDGPGAMSFGIALPSWIVEKENSMWVLGLYALVFMIALPTVVGTWWYRSIRYSSDKVLLDTTRMYYYFFHKTPSMPIKRVIMILGASLEFEKRYNSEIIERESDSYEVPKLISQLGNVGEKNRERPLYYKYSLKARALIHAHLSRIPLNADTLDEDRLIVVKKCPSLIQEMVNCISQLILLAYAQRVPRLLNIETLENCMKLCPMIVQGLWECKSPLLQLPYVQEEHLKHFAIKKHYIRNVQQFARLSENEKRSILCRIVRSDTQYDQIIKVLSKMPHVEFDVRFEVIDDDVSTVYTAGAIVTVTVSLQRQDFGKVFSSSSEVRQQEKNAYEDDSTQEKVSSSTAHAPSNNSKSHQQHGKKNQKQQSSSSKKNKNRSQRQSQPKEVPAAAVVEEEKDNEEGAAVPEEEQQHVEDKVEDDDEEEDRLFRNNMRRLTQRNLDGSSKRSHSVHCPYFPEDKQEYWWVYVSDRKSRTLLTPPYHVTNLIDYQEIQLKFTAPRWPGLYTFTVCLRSDSYLGFDQLKDIKLDVKEAPEIPVDHPQWDISDEEKEEKEEYMEQEVSEFTTDEDVEDD